MENLENSYKLGLEAVGDCLLDFLGENYLDLSELEEVRGLSEAMIRRLLLEKSEEKSQTILRFKTFVKWLSVNSMDDGAKSEVLELFNFDDFTFKELTSDVRKSGLYDVDKIMRRMEELYNVSETRNFYISSEEKRESDTMFDILRPKAGRLSKEKVRNFLMRWSESELPDSTLDKIMELSGQDKDGFLNRYEWTVAKHLAVRAYKYGDEIPDEIYISVQHCPTAEGDQPN